MTHLHPQTQHQQITVTALPEQYNPTISVPASNSPTIINNTYYAAGTVAASADLKVLDTKVKAIGPLIRIICHQHFRGS